MGQVAASVPDAVRPYVGRIVDVDSHEMMPAQVWEETFGDIAKPIADLIKSQPPRPNHASIPDYPGDTMPIDADTIYKVKGPVAPGAVDMDRRLEVMDLMGIKSQLLFPTSIGLWGIQLATAGPEDKMLQLFGGTPEEGREFGRGLVDAHNEWLSGVARQSSRMKTVAPVYGDTVEELIANTRRQIDAGMAGIWIGTGAPLAGKSPAHNDLDPFYAMLAEAKVALHFHIGGSGTFLRTNEWCNAPAFEGFKWTQEISLDPWWLSVVHLSVQNFIATMVTGAVFDRHPELYVCSQEHTAHWIGPLAHSLDMWHHNNHSLHEKEYMGGRMMKRLPMLPSEYIRHNVRVMAFSFEPVGEYLDKYGLEEVYCFASDYPHVEGGADFYEKFVEQIERFGPDLMEKFFVTNAAVLFPD
ncbi:MAG: amidohydrolase family protein [Novosphingobium sp.]|nr:amidohydrolase family protein [Novosphingobium sp.]